MNTTKKFLRLLGLEIVIFAIILFIANIISIIRFLIKTAIEIGTGIWDAILATPFNWVIIAMVVAQVFIFIFYKKQKS